MMEQGFIKLFRSFLDWEWHDSPNMVCLFIHLLILANWEDKQWHGMTIKRGQFVTSLQSLSDTTGISVMSIRTCLKKLTVTGEITQKVTNKYRIVTITNYDSYQTVEAVSKQSTNKRVTNKKQSKNNQLTTTKEYKERKNNKNNMTTTDVVVSRAGANENEFVQPEYAEAFQAWLEYKHQRRETYKSDKSLKACYNKLVRLAHGDPATAMKVVDQSMANNWAGLFELKQDYGTNRSNYYHTGDEGREQRAAAIAASVARDLAKDAARAEAIRNGQPVPDDPIPW